MAFVSKKTGKVITDEELHEMYEMFRKDVPGKTFEEYLDHFFRTDRFEEIEN